MERPVFVRGLAAVLVLCLQPFTPVAAGIQPHAVPRLVRLQDGLTALDPAQFLIAVLMDERHAPPEGTAPHLVLSIQPANPGAFLPLDHRLAMRITTLLVPPANGLPPAPTKTHWAIYALSGAGQDQLRADQSYLRSVQTTGTKRGGARVSIEIDQRELLSTDPALLRSHWETWLQSAKSEGFYPIWKGSQQELAAEAKAQR